MSIDDSALIHYSKGYDPAKAREYYLRTRKLKGRLKDMQDDAPSTRSASSQSSADMRDSRRRELEAQRDALEKRLDRLRDVLAELVEAAKRRSGAKPKPDKDTETSSTKDSKAKDKKGEPDKPLTEKQKREKREASKEQYEKEKGMTLSRDVQQLQAQVQDIRAKIEKAMADAREQTSQSKTQTASKGR